MPDKRSKALPVQCKAIAASGERCKAKPHKKGLCFFHSDPARAAELGRKGGLGNRHVYENDVKEIPAPQTASDVKNFLADAMAEIRAGKMDPKLGTTLGYLGTSLLKAIETCDIEDRLGKLESGLKDPIQKPRAPEKLEAGR